MIKNNDDIEKWFGCLANWISDNEEIYTKDSTQEFVDYSRLLDKIGRLVMEWMAIRQSHVKMTEMIRWVLALGWDDGKDCVLLTSIIYKKIEELMIRT